MKILESKIEDAGWRGRNVLDCGSPLPLSAGGARPVPTKSARGLAQSKTWRRFIALLGFIILHSSFCLRASGQTYSIDWSTIDGGGGTSTGGVYSVSGTIGQPDAGAVMTGGSFSVTGGFWSLLSVVQTPESPLLSIRLTSTNTALVSWPSPSTGFNLQQNTNVNTTDWIGATETINDNGTTKFIIVNPPTASRFYRLFKP